MPKFAANLTMMFTEVPFLERFAAARRAGFRAVEFQRPYAWSIDDVRRAQNEAGVECVLMNVPSGDWDAGERGLACLPGREPEFREGVALALDYARVLQVTRLHATAGIVMEDREACEAVYMENLRWAARRVAQEGITLLIEPINVRAFPGYLLNTLAQASAICDEVGEPNLRLQIDCFHLQISEGDVTRRLREYLPRCGHVQIAGVPDRHEPDTGELRYEHVFALLDEVAYNGWVGCEYIPAGDTVAGLKWFEPFIS
jgi:2-dehydrotetronate isomerase